jgi:hypothetical protein
LHKSQDGLDEQAKISTRSLWLKKGSWRGFCRLIREG